MSRLVWNLGRMICRPITSRMFDLKVYGLRHVPKTGGVLIISNHQSYLDPVLLGVQVNRPMSYLAKSELFKIPGFSWLIRQLNAFPVRQGEGDVGAVRETIRRLQEGHMLNLFPEGTRTENGELSPIQSGVALVIRRAKVPVIPAVIDGSFDAWHKGQRIFHSHPIRLMFGPALALDDLKAQQIVERIDRTFRSMLAELRAEDPAMNNATLDELLAMALKFRDEREWKQFHNFKDLAIKLCLEAAEVLEHVEWKTPEQILAELDARREAIGEELADVLQMVLLLADHAKINLADAYKRKLAKNAERYPIEKARGSAKKYTEL